MTLMAAWLPTNCDKRRDHDRVAEVGAHLGGFFEGLVDLVLHADPAQLMAQVGDHAAGNLMNVLRVIVLRCLADGQIFDFRASGQELARVRAAALHR